MLKTKKSLTKRLKVKKDKTLARQPGVNHYRAKESRVKQLGKKKPSGFPLTKKDKNRFIP